MIPLPALKRALASYDGWLYAPKGEGGTRDCRYAIPFAPWTAPPLPRHTDCVTFVAGVVLGACELAEVLVDWPLDRHRKAMVSHPLQGDALVRARRGDREAGDRHLFGLPDALAEAGLATLVPPGVVPPSWTVLQSWSTGWRKGHAILIGEVSGRTIEIHEASEKAGRVITRTARWPLAWTHQRAVALRVDQLVPADPDRAQ